MDRSPRCGLPVRTARLSQVDPRAPVESFVPCIAHARHETPRRRRKPMNRINVSLKRSKLFSVVLFGLYLLCRPLPAHAATGYGTWNATAVSVTPSNAFLGFPLTLAVERA